MRPLQVHQQELVGHLTPYDPIFRERLSAIATGLGRYSAAPVANTQAYGVLYGILRQQASFAAYIDLFRWTALILVLLLPGAWMLRKVIAKEKVVVH